MDFYQAGYYRVGKQGANSGWKVVSPSEGMSKGARDGFGGIASNLTELKRKISANTTVAAGVFRHDNFVYIMHVNYAAQGEDARGVSYTHGFCMTMQDYCELCKTPELIFGVPERVFPLEYDETVGNYPVVKDLSHDSLDKNAIIDKYRLSDESFRQLMRQAICAVDEYTKPMCIVYDANENVYDVYREIMFLIMSEMPVQLRAKMMTFSAPGSMARIYFSTEPEGDNCFDLRNGSGNGVTTKLDSFRYMYLYNNYGAKDPRRSIMLTQMEANKLDIPAMDADSNHVESSFHKAVMGLKKTGSDIEINAIDGASAVGVLEKYISYPIKNGEQDYDYVQYLLYFINYDGAVLSGDLVLTKLRDYLNQTGVAVDWNAYVALFLRMIQGKENRKEVYAQIAAIEDQTDLYNAFYAACTQNYVELYSEYYLNDFMKRKLKSYKEIDSFVQNFEQLINSDPRYYEVLTELAGGIARRKIENAETMRERMEALGAASKVSLNLQHYQTEYKKFRAKIKTMFLEKITVENFRIEDLETYRNNRENILKDADGRGNFELRTQIEDVYQLVDLTSDPASPRAKEILSTVFIQNRLFADAERRKAFEKQFLEELRSRRDLQAVDGLDCMLAMSYDVAAKTFNVDDMVRKTTTQLGKASWLDGNVLLNWTQRSALVKQYRNKLEDAAGRAYSNKKAYVDNNDKQTWQYIKAILAALNGKAVGGGDVNRNEELAFALHRIAILIYSLVAVIFMGYGAFKNHVIHEQVLSVIIVALCAVVFIGLMILNGVLHDGIIYFEVREGKEWALLIVTIVGSLVLATLSVLLITGGLREDGSVVSLICGAVFMLLQYILLQFSISSAMAEE